MTGARFRRRRVRRDEKTDGLRQSTLMKPLLESGRSAGGGSFLIQNPPQSPPPKRHPVLIERGATTRHDKLPWQRDQHGC